VNICLVNPPVSSDGLHQDWDLSAVDSISPPLGLLSLAAVVRNKGHSVSLIDAYSQGLSSKATVEHILAQDPAIVGLSATTPLIHSAAAIAKTIKSHNSRLKIIIGGPHITAAPQETFKLFPQFDVGVVGEGEETLVELIDYLVSRKEDLTLIEGIVFRKNNDIIETEKRIPLVNMDSLPLPAWDLLPSLNNPYHMSIVGTACDEATAIVTSRGCPGKCTFCDTSVFGNKFRAYSADYTIGMIEHLIANYGIKDFLVYDDNFVTDQKRLKQICQTLIRKEYGINWSCCARVNMINPEILQLMKKAGCWQIEYGIESGSPRILEIMKKQITIERAKQTLKWTKEAGIMTRGNFIFGYLGETEETLKETLEFILDAELDYFQQTFLTPYPGTAVYQTAAQYGDANLNWETMNNLAINFIPVGLTERKLTDFSKLAFRKFYLRPRIIWVQLRRLRSLRDLRRFLMSILAFIKTIFR